MRRRMSREDIPKFFEALASHQPEPETELQYKDPYTLLVAVTLSAQATDVGVNKATARLFPVADTPQKMVDLGAEKLGQYIKTIGLWRNKAKNVIALSKILLDEYGGQVPSERDLLETLPGVGRKTANVVCNVVFGQPTIAVDTHIFRVGNRTGLAPGKTPLDVELKLEKEVPADYIQHAHHWLILHGRYVCKARRPECWRCGVAAYCAFNDKVLEPSEKPGVSKAAAGRTKKKATTQKARKKTTASQKK